MKIIKEIEVNQFLDKLNLRRRRRRFRYFLNSY